MPNTLSALFDLNNVQGVTQVETIPTEFPSMVTDYTVAIIGDFGSQGDLNAGRPFMGTEGEILRSLLTSAGISPMSCMFAYCHNQKGTRVKRELKPSESEAAHIKWNSPELIDSLETLKQDLDKVKPNIIILLGDTPLWVAGKRGEKVSNWHGSLFRCETPDSPFNGYKCMATFSPHQVLRMYEWMPLMRFDLTRAAEEAPTRSLILPSRNYELHLSSYQIIDRLRQWPASQTMALDIEGGVEWMSCLSIASSPFDAFIIPFGVFSPAEDANIIIQLRETMAREDIPKILQNCVYDYFVLAFKYHIHLENIVVDTMLSGWEIYPELPKGLGTQTAIWTREPYYKYQRKIDNPVVHWKYCCTDSCVTYEIAERHANHLSGPSLAHFKFNIELLPVINYIQLRGMRFNTVRAQELTALTQAKQDEIQVRINVSAGKKVNVNSPTQLANVLYKEKKYPKQHPKKAGKYDRTKVTTNIDALLEINRIHDSSFIRDLIAWRKCEKLLQTLAMPTSPRDGRVRCSYNLVGTDTGRLNCYSSNEPSTTLDAAGKVKDVGTNLTTVTKKLRHLFMADEGYEFFQLDLAGADGWTVAAHSSRFGDPTMLDDYNYGIKPARVIAYLFLHGIDAMKLPREELYKLSKYIGNDHSPENTTEVASLYFICKRVQHGTNYLLGANTMRDQILKDSFKLTGNPIYVEPKTCTALQKLYLLRYRGVKAWQTWVEQELKSKGRLSCASGCVRTFFGRRAAHATLRSAVAHEPQANTTYSTNMALRALWMDPENRRSDGSLIIEPLHHVHDAMCGQWPVERRDWAITKLKHYFNNPLTIAGHIITIPFEGAYGPSWGETPHPI